MNAGRRAGRCSCAAVVEAAAAVGANVRRASFGNRSSGVVDPPQLDPPRGAQPTAPRPAPPRSSPGAATSEGRTAPRRTLGRVLEDFDAETSVEGHVEVLAVAAAEMSVSDRNHAASSSSSTTTTTSTPAVNPVPSLRVEPEQQQTSPRDQGSPRELQCVICLDAKKSRACIPCGHVCVCERCAVPLTSCPVCRQPCSDFMRIYLS